MTATRRQIRQAMLDEDVVAGLYGTATAGASGTLTDTTLLAVGGNATSRFANYYLYRPAAANAADNYRRVTATGYAPATGVLTHGGPGYTQAPLAGAPADNGYYELWPYDPRMVNRAVSRALQKRCFSIQQDTFTTNGQTRYDVTAAPISLTSITTIQDQVLEIAQFTGTDPNASVSRWDKAGNTWWPELDNGTLYMRFRPAPTGTLRLTWKAPYANLTDETTSTACPTDYVKWAAFVELFDALGRDAKRRGEPAEQYDDMKADAFTRYWTENHKYLDEYAAQFYRGRPRWKSAVRAPQMGRVGSGRLGGSMGRTITP